MRKTKAKKQAKFRKNVCVNKQKNLKTHLPRKEVNLTKMYAAYLQKERLIKIGQYTAPWWTNQPKTNIKKTPLVKARPISFRFKYSSR